MATPASDLPQSSPGTLLPSLGGYIAQEGALTGVTFWPRVAARVIDLVVKYAIAHLTGLLFGVMLRISAGGHLPLMVLRNLRHQGLRGVAFGLLAALAYHVIFTVIYGSSIGKLVLSIVVVQEDRSPCSLKSAVIRELSYYIDALFFGIIAYTSMQKSVLEQRHGDEWAHTVVCKRSIVPRESLRGPGRFAVALVFALTVHSALLMSSLLIAVIAS
jgi:uncharacterized RDD family membrane protein YckC